VAVAIFSAPGMNVTGRAQKLKREVNKLEGIFEIDINYILDSVSIRYDSRRVTLAEIRRKIEDMLVEAN
jgi:copper chaperone CopZ